MALATLPIHLLFSLNPRPPHVHAGDAPGLSSGTVFGIVFGVLILVFVVIPFVYVFGRDYWRKRHQYDWYNTLTTPSSWCDSCTGGSTTRQRTWQPPSRQEFTVTTSPGNSENALTFVSVSIFVRVQ